MDAEFRKLVTMFERAGNKTGYLDMFSGEELQELILNASVEFLKKSGLNVVNVDYPLDDNNFDVIYGKLAKKYKIVTLFSYSCSSFTLTQLQLFQQQMYVDGVYQQINANSVIVGTNHNYWIMYLQERTKEEFEVFEKNQKDLEERKKKAEEKRKKTKLQKTIKNLETQLSQTEQLKKKLEEAKQKAQQEGIEIVEPKKPGRTRSK